ncbi:MerR family transcriptional regulator [Nocardia mangyaensis]|uniref:MerR family transcriptional regulator n=1 Tax=Nocardia mangyaensis TaxID=2213200 RepID=A0A1J0VY79_9NOCA|nr:MerR family transcriptional regulator [Nocardia mangyaensis]APE36895.1 MerR family transcriptional regulator [Nocardia mangyaensis]MDO3648194.1 MerR family transcriptional regulator [Nocardia mangyaensis]
MAVEGKYTIDELAREAGTTVRSLRVYHERGILPPPMVKGRTGYYSPEHLSRVRTISRLLNRGIKLSGIKELLKAWDRGDGLSDVLGVIDETTARSGKFPSETISATELEQRYHDVPDGLARIVAIGLYQPVDATSYRIANPRLITIGSRLTETGLPLSEVVDELENLYADCDRIARRHVGLFHRMGWARFQQSDRSPDDLATVTEQLAATRVIPGRATVALVSQLVLRHLEDDTAELAELYDDPADLAAALRHESS